MSTPSAPSLNNEPFPWEEYGKCRNCNADLSSSSFNDYFCSKDCEREYYPERKQHQFDKDYITSRIEEWRKNNKNRYSQ